MELFNKRVMVTGGESMIGRHIVDSLRLRNCIVDPCPHETVDFLDILQADAYFRSFNPEVVIHAAGWNGGIEWNKRYPATIYHRNVRMGLNVLTMAAMNQVEKCVSVMASCSYPDTEVKVEEYKEDTLWDGLPNPSVECHGLAKRTLCDYSRLLSKQYDLEFVTVCLTNCYGPHDSYHPDKTKVVGALIRRFVEAKQQGLKEVSCWGTGRPLREFMYCADAARMIVQAAERYHDSTHPINIGSGDEISIYELTSLIAGKVGYEGKINWGTEDQDGQLRKKLDLTRMWGQLEPERVDFTSLEDGITTTIDWYIENKEEADAKLPSGC